MPIQGPIALLLANAPQLREWWEEFADAEDTVTEVLPSLTARLVETRANGTFPELEAMLPGLEVLLAEYDDQDQVSLGFIQPLTWAVRDVGLELDGERIAASLGPRARSEWNHFYLGDRSHDIRPVSFTEIELGALATEPAIFEQWLATPLRWVNADTPLAQLRVNEIRMELRSTVPVWVDRFAAGPDEQIRSRSLLLYLAPRDPRTPKDARLAALLRVRINPESGT
jgi:hypothetical protein